MYQARGIDWEPQKKIFYTILRFSLNRQLISVLVSKLWKSGRVYLRLFTTFIIVAVLFVLLWIISGENRRKFWWKLIWKNYRKFKWKEINRGKSKKIVKNSLKNRKRLWKIYWKIRNWKLNCGKPGEIVKNLEKVKFIAKLSVKQLKIQRKTVKTVIMITIWARHIKSVS